MPDAALGRTVSVTHATQANDAVRGATPVQCGAPALLIHEAQGSCTASALTGEVVTIEGVVVGDFQPRDGDQFATDLGGFNVQEEDDDADDDLLTSEGIFVQGRRPDVQVGQLVRVTGRVSESDGLTALRSVSDPVSG